MDSNSMPNQLGSRKLRNSDITEYRTFPENFMLSPHRSVLVGSKTSNRPANEQCSLYPVLKVVKQTAISSPWNIDAIPTIRGIPNNRMLPKLAAQTHREETFDTDYMMPSRVRKVLEDEGLEHDVINGVIGKSEEKYEEVLRMMTSIGPSSTARKREKKVKCDVGLVLPPVITTKRPVHPAGPDTSWLDLKPHTSRDQQQPHQHTTELCDTSVTSLPRARPGRERGLSRNFGAGVEAEDALLELEGKRWRVAQHAEVLQTGENFSPPRVIVISSRVPKCHLLTKVYQDDVIPIIYDFDACSFTDILEAINRKLDMYRKNCKAKSVMILCQGGAGYIYLLRNYVITPQKLNKASYRHVLGFWRSLAGLVSKLTPEDASIHIAGFNLLDNEQGRQLVPMLQSLVYPNRVRIEVPTELSDAGRRVFGHYFKYGRYRLWKSYQNSSLNDRDDVTRDDVTTEDAGVQRHSTHVAMRVDR